MRSFLKPLVVTALVAGPLGDGCATSSIAQRRAERRAAYDALSPDLRSQVDRGEIAEGLDTNAVFVAWGAPTRVMSLSTPPGAGTRWEYWRNWTRIHPYWSLEPGPFGFYFTAVYRPTTSSWRYLSAWVEFQQDHVVRWHRFPPPAY